MNARIVSFVLISAACFASCKNNDNVFAPVVSTYVNIVNASPDTLNYYLNGTRQNNASSLIPGGATLYVVKPAGEQNYQFKKKGSSDVLFSYPLSLTENTYNSLYITTSNASGAFSTIDTLLSDTLKADSDKTQMRFVHLAPDAGLLNVFINRKSYFGMRSYKSSSVFVLVPSGIDTVKVFSSESSVLLTDTILTTVADKGYTLFTKGLLNGTGSNKLSIGYFNSF